MTVRCFSCGRNDCDSESDFCYGCHKIVCVECAETYGHSSNRRHGCKPKEKDDDMNKELKIQFCDNFEKAINNFDFAKVHSVMNFLDWQWNGQGVPSQAKMIDCVEELFRDAIKCYKEGESVLGIGGFYVELWEDEARVEISFVLTSQEWSNEFNE